MSPERLRKVRLALGLTQTELGLLLNLHTVTMSRWESGLYSPDGHRVALMEAFERASKQSPDSVVSIKQMLVTRGSVETTYVLLRAAFDPPVKSSDTKNGNRRSK